MSDRMPLLESLLPEWNGSQDIVILHINHCMDNSFYFTEKLQTVFGQAVFIAVPYNDRSVPTGFSCPAYHGVQKEGGFLLLHNNHPLEEHTGDFLSATRRLIQLALAHEIKELLEEGKRLVILEDGGYHYPVVEKWLEENPSLANRVLGGVEQTTAGIRASGNHRLRYPIASVARSAYKIRVEAYFVADRVIDELKRILRGQGMFVDFHKILLLGYGIIGRSLARRLAFHHTELLVWDRDEKVMETAGQEGLTPWNGRFFDDMIVLGNVGNPSFTEEMLEEFLNGGARRIFLASSSSKQTEFEGIFHRLKQAKKKSAYQSEVYEFPDGKEIVLLASGFPLNFYDEHTVSLTYSMIDPVFSEMLLSAQALAAHEDRFQNRVYFFGMDEELGGFEEEHRLLSRWMDINHLHFDLDTLNRHPRELRLREMTLEGDRQL